jgi:carboxylesterase
VALRRGLTNAPLELTRLENSYHVATLDNDADQIFDGSVDFIRSIISASTPAGGSHRAPVHQAPATSQEGNAHE